MALVLREVPENIRSKTVDKKVLGISFAMVFPFVIWGILAPDNFQKASNSVLKFFTNNLDWSYLLITAGFVVFAFWIAFSKFGNRKLGKEEDRPEYSLLSWYAMLFSIGMGIGVLFWGVAEPLVHYAAPPYGAPGTPVAAETAMCYTFFHWGLHPWAIYAIVGLITGYSSYKYDLPCSVSSTLYPLLKERVWGIAGKIIDSFAIFATIGGVVTSIGLGSLQINSGLSYVFGLPNNRNVQLVIIIISTVFFTYSAIRGVSKGIKIFSEASFYIGLALMAFLFIFGPARFILQMFTQSVGSYIQNIIPLSFWTDAVQRRGWVGRWTVFYWAWWIAWAPFVGPFFAKISKGRTIREFMIGVLIFPTIFDMVWFGIFGGSSLYFEIFRHAGLAASVQKDVATSVFLLLHYYPLFTITSIATIIASASFYINSADAAIFTAGMLTEKGNLDPDNSTKMVWGIISGTMAAVLLYSGGLDGLQTASVVAAFPFMLIMVAMCVSLVKLLNSEETVPFRGK